MSLDAVANFAKATLASGYAAGVTSIVVGSYAAGSSGFPATPFNAVWWDATNYADPADDPNVEIVRVTNIAGSTLTVTRAQEGTSDSDHNTPGSSYKLIESFTEFIYDQIAAAFANAGQLWFSSGSSPDLTWDDSLKRLVLFHEADDFLVQFATGKSGLMDPSILSNSNWLLAADFDTILSWVTGGSTGTNHFESGFYWVLYVNNPTSITPFKDVAEIHADCWLFDDGTSGVGTFGIVDKGLGGGLNFNLFAAANPIITFADLNSTFEGVWGNFFVDHLESWAHIGNKTNISAIRNAAQSVPMLAALASDGITFLSGIDKSGYFVTSLNVAPADGDIANSEIAVWFDPTIGAAQVNFKGKDTAGTVVTGAVALV